MSNDFYTPSGTPVSNSSGASSAVRSEFQLIESAFNKFPALTANGSKFLRINSGATAVEALSASDALTALLAADGELSSIAGLTSAANKLPYFTGSGTAAVADFTAGGRALVNSAGTADTFPYFSALNTVTLGSITAGGRALVNNAGTVDTFPYFSSANTVTLGSITTAGRALLDDADASAQRTTLGLGTMATQNSNNVSITAGSVFGITSVVQVSQSVNPDSLSNGSTYSIGIAVSGLLTTDLVTVNLPSAWDSLGSPHAIYWYVTAGFVVLVIHNVSGGTVNLGTGTVRINVLKLS